MSWRVPLADVLIPDEDIEAVLDCLRSGWLTMGPRTQQFEAAFAAYTGSVHAIAVSNGTAALHLACVAAGLGPGDEAIVPGLTFVSTANAVRYTGARAILCEVGGVHDLNIDVEDVARRISARTKAVLAVHFCGYPAAVAELRQLCETHGLVLIEDCAQGIGAVVTDDGRRAGTVGDLACFSLFSKKQLCVGEGGVVTTDDPDLAARVRSLRSHAMTSVTWDRHRGYASTYDVTDIGFNYRIDEARCALALARLERLDDEIAARRRLARTYRRRLSGIDFAWDAEAVERSSHFSFPVILPDRHARFAFRESLHAAGVQTTCYPPLHELSDFALYSGGVELPRAEDAADRHCAIPMSSHMPDDQLEIVIDAVGRALEEQGLASANPSGELEPA